MTATLERLESVAGVNAPDPTSWGEFWPYYVSQHLHPVTRLFHVWGPITAAVVGIALIAQGHWWAVPAGFAIGYGLAWFSHFVIEKNKPASFGHPLWSFRGDMRLIAGYFSGQLARDVADVRRACGLAPEHVTLADARNRDSVKSS